MRRRLLISQLIFSAAILNAQQPKLTNWITVQAPIVLNNKWQLLTEASYRTVGESFVLNQLFLRTGFRHTINAVWNVAAATDYVHSKIKPDKANHEYGNEFRIWQEVTNRTTLKKNWSWLNRFRIEERFYQTTSVQNAFTGYRLRYRMGVLKTISPKWDVMLADEYLRQFQKGDFVFNQNRIQLATYYRFAKTAHFQFDYYLIKFPRQYQHVFSLIFQKRILVKKKNDS